MAEMGALSLTSATESPVIAAEWTRTANATEWRTRIRHGVLAHLAGFIAPRHSSWATRASMLQATSWRRSSPEANACGQLVYLGWLCGAAPDEAALRAAASFELLHVFALLQDDVMDSSTERRGRPSAHLQFAQWHRERGLSGSSRRFGESAAILLGDLCLIWSEQMLRESGIEPRRLQQAWPRYDTMRTELAVGQFADLTNDVRHMPSLEEVLDVARRKSGNYTVRRPLEIGAAMADCDDRTLTQLGRYGAAVGEAFQLRDDVLGVLGSPATTGKPCAGDLLERKATSLVVTAHQLADPPTRAEMTELMNGDAMDACALDRWKALILETGAVDMIEEMISDRVAAAREHLGDAAIEDHVRVALDEMAAACTDRAE